MLNNFYEWLVCKKWIVELNERKEINLSPNFINRYSGLNLEHIEFLKFYDKIISNDEKIWFLCQDEYNNTSNLAFKWNEFEELSLEAAEYDEEWKHDIINWWDNIIPIIISVRNGYIYYAINIENNSGEIIKGEEPEFEETEVVANNLYDFLHKLINEEIII